MNERNAFMNMKRKRRSALWRRATVGGLALLSMLMIGTALAAIPNNSAHFFSAHPLIAGSNAPLILLLGLLALGTTGLVSVVRELLKA